MRNYIVRFCETEELPKFTEAPIEYNQDFSVYREQNGDYIRCYHDHKNNDRQYAVTRFEPEQKLVQVDYLPEGAQFFSEVSNSFFHIGWETLLLHEKRMILHAACVDTPHGGILFSGSSGVGKSTQADLWCRFMNARLLNGDRTVLHAEQKGWMAYGSPYAGSSRCYVNDSCPVKAVVMLKQTKQCTLRRLGMAEAFHKVYAQATVNSWNTEYVTTLCDLIIALVTDIPVYELSCTPDRDAVEILQKELMEGK
ncbi:MAG: hypothetical protein MR966_05790 [Lachnospiraceae bacterium]|nr:hypothetical protein [Lachnospiraceae bacterium]